MQNEVHIMERLDSLRAEMRDLMRTGGDWNRFALEVFRFQADANAPYGEFVRLRGLQAADIQRPEDIPHLPVEFFQSHRVSVLPEQHPVAKTFCSSGTTGQRRSQHHVDDLDWYGEVARAGYRALFGTFEDVRFIGLLPGYLERSDASLVHMVRDFMECSRQPRPESAFFLKDFRGLEAQLEELNAEASAGYEGRDPREVVIVGVTHALLQWAEGRTGFAQRWPSLNVRIIETGGMKGRGRERIREEVHAALELLSSDGAVGSEYGMTEMLSQAWSKAHGRFTAPPWMQVRAGALNDPGSWAPVGRQGRIHVMDLANLASCAFLATGDIGRMNDDGTFGVLGRFDHAEVRGCNLMAFE